MIFVSLKLNGRYITSKDELMSELPTPVDEIYINILKLDSHVEQIDSIPCNELKQNETLQYERYLKKIKELYPEIEPHTYQQPLIKFYNYSTNDYKKKYILYKKKYLNLKNKTLLNNNLDMDI